MLAWGVADVVSRWPRIQPAIAVLGAAGCVACLVLTWKQVAYWRNTETLFLHAIDVTENNWGAQYYLGNYYMKIPERRAEAVEHFEAALRIKPDLAEASNILGVCMAQAGLCAAAIPRFEAALRLKPGLSEADNNLGWCLIESGRYQDAIPPLEAGIRANPENAEYHYNLARALEKLPGRAPDAITQYQTVLRLNPDYMEAHNSLGTLLASLGRTDEANAHFATAETIQRKREDTRR
jgi:protein O-mannosyl-transferase